MSNQNQDSGKQSPKMSDTLDDNDQQEMNSGSQGGGNGNCKTHH